MASSLNTSSLQGYYDSWEALLHDVQTVSLAQGFAARILWSANYRDGQYTRYDIICVCEGHAPQPKTHQERAQRATLRYGYEFQLRGVFRRNLRL